MRNKLAGFLNKDLSIFLLFLIVDLVFFWKYFLLGLIPIPADVVIGGYFPWLDQKWGYAVGVPVKNALMSDVVSLLYPWRLTAIELIKSGQLPLWDQTSFLGTSLIGNFQAGIFNPFNLLFLLPFDFKRIWGLQVVIQPFLAMVTMYFFLRNWKISKVSSVFGSISYAFSAQVLVWIEYNTLSFALAVFPLFLLILDKFLETKKILYLCGVSLVMAYIIFVGYPQHLYYFTFFGLLFISFMSYSKSKRSVLLLNGALYLAFIVLGLCLAAVVLLPGIEALGLSIKSLDKAAQVNSVLFLPWQNLLTVFIPDFFGNPATNNYFGTGYYESLIFYTSIVALPFAFIVIPESLKSKKIGIISLFLLSALILALNTPISQMLQYFSFLGLKGSVSSRVLFVYGFSISCLAAFGLDHFRKSGKDKDKFYLKYLPVITVSGILAGVLVTLAAIKISIGDLGLITQDFGKIVISIRNIVIPLGLSLALALIAFLSRYGKLRPYLIVLIFCLLFIDYYKFSSKYLPFIKEDLVFPKTGTLDFLRKTKEPFRIAIQKAELLPANTWSIYGLESISGYNILLPKETADYLNYLNSSQLSRGYSRVVDINNLNSPFLDLANVKYLLVLLSKKGSPDASGEPPYNMDTGKYSQVFKEGAVVVYENKDYLPRFYTVNGVDLAQDTESAYRLINSGNFDYKKNALIEHGSAEAKLSECRMSVVSYSAQSASIDANCPGNSFLVFSQLYYPGWRAKINERNAEIIKTNGIFSGIYLSPGESSIQISYSPDSFRIGALISSITAILFAVFMLTARNFRLKQ